MTDRSTARAVKTRLAGTLGQSAHVNGIGLTQRQGSWMVKVNLDADDTPTRDQIPNEVDGVPVVVEVVGRVTAQGLTPPPPPAGSGA